MIQWSFAFEREECINSDIHTEEEDLRISQFMQDNPTGILYMPGKPVDFYLNLANAKWITRTVFEDTVEDASVKTVDKAAENA